mmetsp:Transcript_1693/g.1618  ORF Transcript_1693/g.1618 Transcript_1693/m.1618 type:complete len:214 (-) Transcript_1693:528-1169(-)
MEEESDADHEEEEEEEEESAGEEEDEDKEEMNNGDGSLELKKKKKSIMEEVEENKESDQSSPVKEEEEEEEVHQKSSKELMDPFLTTPLLEERVKMAMSKYDLKKLDSGCLQLFNDAIKQKYSSMVNELIQISRSSASFNYVYNKQSLPGECKRVNYKVQEKVETQKGAFEVTFTSNHGLEFKNVLEEEERQAKMLMQEQFQSQEEAKKEEDG